MNFFLRIFKQLLAVFLFLIQLFFFSYPGNSQQKIQIINDNKNAVPDSSVWVLVTGNPASVSGMTGVRDLSSPPATVSGNATSNTKFNATYSGTQPNIPFPIQFTSGTNAGDAVYKVIKYTSSTFTLASPLPNLPQNGDQFIVGAYSQKLSTLNKTGSFNSTLSGQSVNIYEFTANSIAAGVIFISQDSYDLKGAPLSGQLAYLNASPSFQSTNLVPFQTVELSTGAQTSVDTTVIDYFSIPLQIEALDANGQSIPSSIRTFYASTDTIKKKIESLGATPIKTNNGKDFVRFLGPGQTIINNGNGSPKPYMSFSHYLNSLVTNNDTFSISKIQQGFINPDPPIVYGLDVSQYFANYSYDGVVEEATVALDGYKGYKIVLTPNANPAPPATPVNSITPHPPTTTVSTIATDIENTKVIINLPDASLNQTIYGATLTIGDNGSFKLDPAPSLADYPGILTNGTVTAGLSTTTFICTAFANKNYIPPFSITFTTGSNTGKDYQVSSLAANGIFTVTTAFNQTPSQGDKFTVNLDEETVLTQFYTNSVYSYAVADVLAALNFGFLGSQTAGDKGTEWYALFPQRFPYVTARTWTNHNDDRYYNEWASIFYNYSDAYSFAFSDRVSPSPLIGVETAQQTLRITCLPENQLAAPISQITQQTDSEIDISWPASGTDSGTTYEVSVEPGNGTITMGSDNLSAKITGLQAGTPYTINVQAKNGKQASKVLPLYTGTTGAFSPLAYKANKGIIPFQISFTWALGANTLPDYLEGYVNGTKITDLSVATNVPAFGTNGSNIYVVDLKDKNTGDSLFKTALIIGFDVSGTAPTQFSVTGTPVLLYNDSVANPVSLAPSTGPYTVTYNGDGTVTSPLVVALNFDPLPRKEVTAFSPEDQATMTVAVAPNESWGTTLHSLGEHVEPINVAIPIKATPAAGYSFKGWTVSGSGVIADTASASTTVTLSGNATITANFVQSGTPSVTLTMAVSPGASGTTTPAVGGNPETVNVPVPIIATPAGGFSFSKWTVSGPATIEDSQSASTKVTISGDTTVTAVFVATPADATLTMAASSAAGGTTTPAVGANSVPKEVPQAISAFPAEGYNFFQWTVAGTAKISDASKKDTSVTLTGDATVTAVFVEKEIPATLSISVAPDGAGTTNPGANGDISCYIGQVFSISAQNAAGYHFTGWTGGGLKFAKDPSHNNNSITITSATATLTANFEADTVPATLTVAVVGSGTTNPGVGLHTGYQVGEVVTIQASPDDGNHFIGWTGNGVTITDDKNDKTSCKIDNATPTITANFEADVNPTTLTVSVNPSPGGTTNPGIGIHTNFHVGELITVNAVPASAYHFTGWSGSGLTIAVNTDPVTIVTITGAVSDLTAGFAENALTVDIELDRISEQGGKSKATVTRNSGTTGDLTVNLSSSDTNEATVPATVTIKDGSDTAEFIVTAVDDKITDGNKTVTITASTNGYIDGTDSVIVTWVKTFVLTVKQGTGSGKHVPGVVVPISSDPPQTGQVFDKWTGDVAKVANVNASSTTITMPAKATVIQATYKTDPASALSLTVGTKISLNASEVSGMDSEFTRKPTVYGEYTDPVKQREGTASTKGITRISAKSPSDIYVSQWVRAVALFNKKEWVQANKAGTSTADWINSLPNNKIDNLSCSLWVKTVNQDGERLDVHFRGALLVPPAITDAVGWDSNALTKVHPGSKIVIQGNYFGQNPPVVGLEYTDSKGTKKQQKLKVIKPLSYPDAHGNDGKSCMDLSSATGLSSLTVQMPKTWWKGWVAGDYDLVINNKIGLATHTISTTDTLADPNNAPAANDDNVSLEGGDSFYLIDVKANDSDADADAVNINLPSNSTTLNGRVSVSSGMVKYIPPAGAQLGALPDPKGLPRQAVPAFLDTFTYFLDDGNGGTSGIASVSVAMNTLTIDPFKHWDGDVLGTRTVQPGSLIVITGQHFGVEAPKVTLTMGNGKKRNLPVISAPPYENYQGNPAGSFTDLTTGDSKITVALPALPWAGYTDSTAYTITVSNKIDTVGADGTFTTSSANSAPVANDDDVDIFSGQESYFIDVLSNQSDSNDVSFNSNGVDADAESDQMTIILQSETSSQGAEISVDVNTNTVKYTRAQNLLCEFTDTFTYRLRDPSGAESDIATVIVNGKLNP